MSANDLADLFISHVFRSHSLPDEIISDRGPQFASEFWQRLCERERFPSEARKALKVW